MPNFTNFWTPNVSLDLDLQTKIGDKIGHEKAREIMSLLVEHGINIITKLGSAEIHLPNLEIRSLTPRGEYGADMNHPARRHLFECKINGKTFGPMLQKVELDPFDYGDGEVFKAKLTIMPVISTDEEDEK